MVRAMLTHTARSSTDDPTITPIDHHNTIPSERDRPVGVLHHPAP